MFAVLPTALTLGNAVCGFGAITFASKWGGFDTATSLFAAACLIYLAMVFDMLDGSTARWTNQTSEFGEQLDSLCDAVSFGAAPALLMIQFSQPFGYHPRLLWMVAALYVICTVLRLARYNVEPEDAEHPRSFTGLPSPAAAAVIASFPVMVFGPELLADTPYDLPREGYALLDTFVVRILPAITFAVAGLMVSRVRYHRHFLIRGRRSGPSLIKLILVFGAIAAIPRIAAPLLSCWYAFATPLQYVWDKLLGRTTRPPEMPLPLGQLPTQNGAREELGPSRN
jgi:CDP-diacylglycerol--serine O-phosphatidyltransferase